MKNGISYRHTIFSMFLDFLKNNYYYFLKYTFVISSIILNVSLDYLFINRNDFFLHYTQV